MLFLKFTFLFLNFQNLSVDEILTEIRNLLVCSGIVDSHLAKPLFDSLQCVALGRSTPVGCSIEQERKKVITWFRIMYNTHRILLVVN